MQALLEQEGLEVRLSYKGRTERLSTTEYPVVPGAESLFAQFSAMHLLAPHLPKNVAADFPIAKQMIDLIGRMYASEGKAQPSIKTPSGEYFFPAGKTSPHRAVISYSAGKDSMWNLWWTQEKYGVENVLAVHIAGLNRANAKDERIYARRQSENFGFLLEMLTLQNGSGGKGFQVMRSRDMFMVGIIIPYAIRFGASKVIIEGYSKDGPGELFTGNEENMKDFNRTLASMKVPVRVAWKNDNEMDVVQDLYENKPEWMKDVCNCFSAPCYKPPLRSSWERRTPSIKMYDSQCGSCVKCRIINISRLLHDQSLKTTSTDVQTYIKSTRKWITEKIGTHRDMITPRFVADVEKVAKKYGLNA